MRVVTLLAGAALTTCLAGQLAAQDAAGEAASVAADTVEEAAEPVDEAMPSPPVAPVSAAEPAPSIAPAPPPAPPAPPAPPVCELRVFPTLEGQAQTTGLLSGMGIIGAVVEAEANKDRNMSEAEYLQEALGPKFQMRALNSIDVVSELGLPEGTEVMFETPIADRKITTKAKTRLTSSTADCYAELLITQNLYQKKMIYGRSLNNRFIFKDFRGGLEKTKMVKGRGGNGLKHFPPKSTDEMEAADEDLRQAFVANFLEYSKRFN